MTPAQRRFTAKRFLGMLESGREVKASCPFQIDYKENSSFIPIPFEDILDPCDLCREAVDTDGDCPCYVLGCQEAYARARFFIEDSGILEVKP